MEVIQDLVNRLLGESVVSSGSDLAGESIGEEEFSDNLCSCSGYELSENACDDSFSTHLLEQGTRT